MIREKKDKELGVHVSTFTNVRVRNELKLRLAVYLTAPQCPSPSFEPIWSPESHDSAERSAFASVLQMR